MRTLILMLVFYAFAFAQVADVQLAVLWETPAEFKTPESVIFDPHRNLIYVSNISGKPTETNQKGFLSKLDLEGTILDLYWITDLDAPKGSAIYKDVLYVADVDKLVAIDLDRAAIIDRYPAKDAVFLNDVAIDRSGSVYVSDYSAENSMIYKLVEDSLHVFLQGKHIDRPNGLFYEQNRLMIGNAGDRCLKYYDFESDSVSSLGCYDFGIDGIARLDDKHYLVSQWDGRVFAVSSEGENAVILDTRNEKKQSADIATIPAKSMLLVPTFTANKITAYRWMVLPSR